MYCLLIFFDLAYSEHEETDVLAVHTYANEHGVNWLRWLSGPSFISDTKDLKVSRHHLWSLC